MRRTITLLAAMVAAVAITGCAEEKGGTTGAPGATPDTAAVPTTTASAAPTTTAPAAPTTTAAAADTAGAAPTAAAAAETAAAAASAAPAATASAAAAAPTGSAAAGPKTFDCGAKGQKMCPMQGWMKTVMASASSSGDGTKLASALAYVAGRTPPGMGQWASISNKGVAAAKAGDIDGAKATCKQCHDLYKEKYKASMRDRPF